MKKFHIDVHPHMPSATLGLNMHVHHVTETTEITDMIEDASTFGYTINQLCKRLALVGFAEQPASDNNSYCFFIVLQTKHYSVTWTAQR
jgi:hypothetical protein